MSSDQGPFLKSNQAIKVNFCPSKILTLVADGSIGLTKVTTPCSSLLQCLHWLESEKVRNSTKL